MLQFHRWSFGQFLGPLDGCIDRIRRHVVLCREVSQNAALCEPGRIGHVTIFGQHCLIFGRIEQRCIGRMTNVKNYGEFPERLFKAGERRTKLVL